MPGKIIDSLFLELGIDTSRFSQDQKKALAKIQQFEAQTKKSADKAAQRVQTVGEAFRSIADDSSVGASAKRLDTMALKLRNLGQAGRVSGGATGGLGMMAEGLGALLSPAALSIAALGLLGKAAWDFNKKMTATNATLARQSQLSGINSRKLWAWGVAAKTVGGSATDIPNFMVGMQTQLAGGFTGFGNPGQMLAGMALMGIPYKPGQSVNPASLIEGYRRYAASRGGGTFGWDAARAMSMQTGLYDASLFKFALPGGGGLSAYEYAKRTAPKSFNATLMDSLKSQRLLGYNDIQEAVIAERAYGGIQNPMATLVRLMTDMLAFMNRLVGLTMRISEWIAAIAEHFGINALETAKKVLHGAEKGWHKGGVFGAVRGAASGYDEAANASIGRRMGPIVQALMARGMSPSDAAAMAGNFMQESSLNPNARNGSHFGLAQWDAARQALARQNGFNLDTENGQLAFAVWELHNTPYGKQALAHMRKSKTLQGRTSALDAFFERSGELSYDPKAGRYLLSSPMAAQAVFNRIRYARDARSVLASHVAFARAASTLHHLTVHNNITHATRIGDIHVHTPTTDPRGHAEALRKGVSTHPLINPTAQHQVILSTQGMAG